MALIAALVCVGAPHGTCAVLSHEGKTLPSCLIGLQVQDRPSYVLVVEKASQTLRLYEWNGTFSLKQTFPCSTGEVSGKKQKTGDRKTPEGVFFFTKAFKKKDLSATYGSRAFVLDYPNLMDRKEKRSGYNIWLHGTNKRLKKRDTNGCVAMKNKDLDALAPYIGLNRTPIIIKAQLHMMSEKDLQEERQKLLAFLSQWNGAFTSGDRHGFRRYYETSATGHDGLWTTWDDIRDTWKQAKVPFELKQQNLVFARSNPCVVALFDQVATLDKHVMRVGTVKLFLEPEKGSWKIIGEEYQPSSVSAQNRHPVAVTLSRLETLRKEYKTVAELIAEWADAWSSKDIKRYQACYARDFYARRMDLKAWIAYKKRLNKRYRKIEVIVEDLEVSKKGSRGTATFVQRYSSNYHESVGIKRLRLKQENGIWKIYRETWHKI